MPAGNEIPLILETDNRFSAAGSKAQLMLTFSGIDTIASGGVKNLDDIVLLKHSRKVAGVIVGKAFYEGTLDLREAFARCS